MSLVLTFKNFRTAFQSNLHQGKFALVLTCANYLIEISGTQGLQVLCPRPFVTSYLKNFTHANENYFLQI